MNKPLVIRGGHVVDPSQDIDGHASILVEGKHIHAIGTDIDVPEDAEIIDADGKHVFPGLVDARVYVGEPGSEHRETIKSASKAAAAGGVTSFIMMPETDPVIDDVALVDFVRRAARDDARVRVYPAVSVTKGMKGKELTEFGLLQEAGAVMLTEGKRSLENNLTLRRALTYARDFGLVIAKETIDADLSANGVMNEGLTATHLGLPGIPREAEIITLERDLRIAALARGRYHAAKISTSDSAEIIAQYKRNGHDVTCGVSINHLTLNENDIGRYRTYLRLSPPLRNEDDRQAMIRALADGTIDIIVSSHDPHDADTKRFPFAEAAEGAIGLETVFAAAMRLYHNGEVPLTRLIDAMSTRPARIFGLPGGTLKPGAKADIIITDIEEPWVLHEEDIVSQSKNTTFEGERFSGRIVRTLVSGKTIHQSP
ncbi:MAG: dihydroorotase [Rhizobiaceae bacterium]|nr:dihydroorotase [Rhizobiaceae bacterium]